MSETFLQGFLSNIVRTHRARDADTGKLLGSVLQFPVHNDSYPRNRRIREYLIAQGWSCTPILRGKGKSATMKEKILAVYNLLSLYRSADVLVLSEMSLKYAPLTWALSRLTGAVHVVDGFIGLYETDVEDKGLVRKKSFKARLLKFQDRLALNMADIYLVDTELRAHAVRRLAGSRSVVLSLPVGAPKWAHDEPDMPKQPGFDVLYYGNYIPLHGLRDYVMAVSRIPALQRPVTKMIGSGACYNETLALVEELNLGSHFVFQDPVPESELVSHIRDAHVVLGIFGSSTKAATVIANKVWQGLACGRPVITRQSKALDEITDFTGDLLIQVQPNNPDQLAASLRRSIEQKFAPRVVPTHQLLEDYVNARYQTFFEALHQQLGLRGRKRFDSRTESE